MFFFRVTLANFDDEKKVFFMFPDQQALDENGIPPFSETDLCSHQIFKKYVKDTKTSVVDVSYVLFKTSANAVISDDSLNDEQFEQLKKDNKLSEIDSNEISIITNKKKSSSGKNSSNTSFYFIIAGMALFVIILLVISTITSKDDENSETSSIMEISSDMQSLS